MEVESINSKTNGVDDDGGCKSKGGVKVKRYHDGQFPEHLRLQIATSCAQVKICTIEMKNEYDIDKGAPWQPSRCCRRWAENAVAN